MIKKCALCGKETFNIFVSGCYYTSVNGKQWSPVSFVVCNDCALCMVNDAVNRKFAEEETQQTTGKDVPCVVGSQPLEQAEKSGESQPTKKRWTMYEVFLHIFAAIGILSVVIVITMLGRVD